MERLRGILACILIVLMDIVAGVLGIQAEISQNKSTNLRKLVFGCKEPVHQAFELGVIAAVLLAAAHAIGVSIAGCCISICSMEEFKRSSANKKMAAVTSTLSWITLLAGLTTLTCAAMSNSSKPIFSCGFSHRHLFSFGGILCFLHGVFCVSHYVSATAAVAHDGRKNQADASI